MRGWRLSLVCLVALAFGGVASLQDQEVVCYLASWAVYRPNEGKFTVEDVDPTLCTTLIFAFAGLDEQTFAIKALDPIYDLSEKAIDRSVSLKAKNPKLKVVIAIGGWTEGSTKYSAMVSNSTSRSAFINSTVHFIKNFNLDGLNLDWQYPSTRGGSPHDKQNFVLLAKELREEFDHHGWTLSASVAAEKPVIDVAYNISELSKYLDFIHVGAYDYHGKWDGRTGHHAPLYPREEETGAESMMNVDATIKVYLDRGAPPHKLVLGLAFFGRSFILQDPTRNGVGAPTRRHAFAGPYTKEDGFLGYNEICQKQVREKGIWTLVWQKTHQVPYMYQDNMWVSYDDPISISLKVAYAQKLGLGGVIAWSVDTDDFNGTCSTTKMRYPLLSAIWKAMKTHSNTTTEDHEPMVPQGRAVSSETHDNTSHVVDVEEDKPMKPTESSVMDEHVFTTSMPEMDEMTTMMPEMGENATEILEMLDELLSRTVVDDMSSNATLGDVSASSTIGGMAGNSTMDDVSSNSTMDDMSSNSTMGEMASKDMGDMSSNSTMDDMSNSTMDDMSNDISSNSTMDDMSSNSTMDEMSSTSTMSPMDEMPSTTEMDDMISTVMDDMKNMTEMATKPTPTEKVDAVTIATKKDDAVTIATKKDDAVTIATKKEDIIHRGAKPVLELGDESVDDNKLDKLKYNRGDKRSRGKGDAAVAAPAISVMLVVLTASLAVL